MEDVGIVGTEAFKNCHINTMTLKGSLSAIGDRAFIGCGNLDKVTIQSSTPYTIGKYAFTCASIKEVTFSDGLSSVAEGTFSGCGKLSKVYLPTTLKEIEKMPSRMYRRSQRSRSMILPKLMMKPLRERVAQLGVPWTV